MDEGTFSKLALACERKLYRVARTILRSDVDCQDALQEAVFRAWSRRNTLREPRYFDTWLIRILINECRNIQRRGMQQAAIEPPPPSDSGELLGALMALDEKYRLVTELHYIEGYQVAEIAAMIRVPQGTVKWRLSRARALLKEALS